MIARIASLLIILLTQSAFAQLTPMHANLPIGSHRVGFKIITITDKTRIAKPLLNYFGERETGDRARKIYVHLWYPAKPNTGKISMTYGEYAVNDLFSATSDKVAENLLTGKLSSQRSTFEGFFGKISDEQWKTIAGTRMLAFKDATWHSEKFPLLIGMLRPLSTSVTNEVLASNGYVVAMVKHSGSQYPLGHIDEIQDMQLAMKEIGKFGIVADEDNIGTFGFSGSGFTQVVFAMHDPRVRALADLESGLFMDGLFQKLSSSDFYSSQRLKIPFLHLFGTDLSKEEVFISEFEKLRYSDRYRVILNQTKMHHWDFATEGRASTTLVSIRGEKEKGLRSAYEIANLFLIEFFNAELKAGQSANSDFRNLSSLKKYSDSLYTMTYLPKVAAPPSQNEFVAFIDRHGIQAGLNHAREIWARDTLAEVLHENILNMLSQQYGREKKEKESLAMMKFATELHPNAAWLWNNLGSLQEDLGLKEDALQSSEKVVALLTNDQGTELSFNQRIKRSSEARIKRLKGL